MQSSTSAQKIMICEFVLTAKIEFNGVKVVTQRPIFPDIAIQVQIVAPYFSLLFGKIW
jgi:hypothetical protein